MSEWINKFKSWYDTIFFQNLALYWVGLFVNLHNDLLIQIIFFLTLTKKNGLDFSLGNQVNIHKSEI